MFTDKEHAYFPLNYASRDFDIKPSLVCSVEKVNYDYKAQGDKVMKEFARLFTHSSKTDTGNVVPLRLNPNAPIPPLKRNEVEGIVELRCPDEACIHVNVDHAEGHWGERDEWHLPVNEAKK